MIKNSKEPGKNLRMQDTTKKPAHGVFGKSGKKRGQDVQTFGRLSAVILPEHKKTTVLEMYSSHEALIRHFADDDHLVATLRVNAPVRVVASDDPLVRVLEAKPGDIIEVKVRGSRDPRYGIVKDKQDI